MATPSNTQDVESLTDYWRRETIHLNDRVDAAFKEAQDHAYALGLARGKSEAAQNQQATDTASTRGAVGVLLQLLREADTVLSTIEPEGTEEADLMSALRGRIEMVLKA